MPGTVRSIQGLRAVAALLVVLAHCGDLLQHGGRPLFDGRPLEVGVDIFFVISGFIMATVAVRAGTGPAAAGAFLLRRAARLLPLYWLLTTAAVVARWQAGHAPGAAQVLASYLLIPDIEHGVFVDKPLLEVGWTLIYEVYFYLLMALAIGCRLGRRSGLAAVAALLATVWAVDRLTGEANAYLAHYGAPMVFEFAIGGALALAAPMLKRLPVACPAAAAAALAAVLAVAFGPPDIAHGSVAWGGAAGLACLAGILAEENLPWRRLSPLLWLGDISYALYLSHYVMVRLMAQLVLGLFDPPPMAAGPVFLAAVLVASIAQATLLYAAIERPARQALGRLVVRRVAPASS